MTSSVDIGDKTDWFHLSFILLKYIDMFVVELAEFILFFNNWWMHYLSEYLMLYIFFLIIFFWEQSEVIGYNMMLSGGAYQGGRFSFANPEYNGDMTTFTLVITGKLFLMLLILYHLSNVILVDEKFTSFHQYLRYCHKSGTIVFSIPGAMLWV